ncbi:hypothetical protein AMATHDRAFT_130164, partial [Amanita thiersii Skay4041]
DSEPDDTSDYGPALPPETTSKPDNSSTSVTKRASASSPGPSTSRRHIGPALPPQLSGAYYEYDDDDDDIGPKPLPSGLQHEKDDAVKRFMEVEEKRLKNIEVGSSSAKPKVLQRDEWMLKPPSSSDLLVSLDPKKLTKARQFSRTTAPSTGKVDHSLWTETPAEKQQRLADEVMGKRRRAVDVDQEVDDDKKRRRKDEEHVRRGIDDYTTRVRGAALIEQHAAASAKKNEKDEPPVIWDHARDMALGGRLMDDEKRNKFIKEARGLGDRFNTGKSGGFL